MKPRGYSVRKVKDEYALYYNGQLVEVFASKRTANKWKTLSEQDRIQRKTTR